MRSDLFRLRAVHSPAVDLLADEIAGPPAIGRTIPPAFGLQTDRNDDPVSSTAAQTALRAASAPTLHVTTLGVDEPGRAPRLRGGAVAADTRVTPVTHEHKGIPPWQQAS